MGYWHDHPPLHIAVGAVLKGLAGVKSSNSKFVPSTQEEIEAAVRNLAT